MINSMITDGYTGDKGKGGFYLTGADEVRMARPLTGAGEALAAYRVAATTLPGGWRTPPRRQRNAGNRWMPFSLAMMHVQDSAAAFLPGCWPMLPA